MAALLAGVGAVAFLAMWLWVGPRRSDIGTTSALPSAAAPVQPPVSSETTARSAVEEADPIVAESRRLIERESRHAGLPEPPTSSDDRVYLRGGGSITRDQYRDAQRRVQESPVLRTPLPAPPVP